MDGAGLGVGEVEPEQLFEIRVGTAGKIDVGNVAVQCGTPPNGIIVESWVCRVLTSSMSQSDRCLGFWLPQVLVQARLKGVALTGEL